MLKNNSAKNNSIFKSIKNKPIIKLSQERVKKYTKSVEFSENKIIYDFSKTHFSDEEFNKIKEMLKKKGLEKKIEEMREGKHINYTEDRAVLHYKLRENINKIDNNDINDINDLNDNSNTNSNSNSNSNSNTNHSFDIDNNSLHNPLDNMIRNELLKMKSFENQFDHKLGATGKNLKYIVNIGIGGSDLGPKFINDALSFYQKRKVFFFSNVDPSNFYRNNIKIDETLFIIVSKSFTTIETVENMKLIISEYKKSFENSQCKNSLENSQCKNSRENHIDFIKKQFVAVTALENPTVFDIPITKFSMWDFVGGRFSLWSAVGLSIVLGVGFEIFSELLEGAFIADKHAFENKLESIPGMMAIVEIYYRNFYNECLNDNDYHNDSINVLNDYHNDLNDNINNNIIHQSYFNNKCIVAYDSHLELLYKYLQQAEMESNGKEFSGQKIIWGGVGTDVQHSFFQYLHQCDENIYLEVLLPMENLYEERNSIVKDHHKLLIANCLAQTRALMIGDSKNNNNDNHNINNSIDNHNDNNSIDNNSKNNPLHNIINPKKFKGNKPSTTILYKKLTPKTLGFIIATYEHKIFFDGIFYGINSFDQFGVQLGKKLAMEIYEGRGQVDPSTENLIKEITGGKNKL